MANMVFSKMQQAVIAGFDGQPETDYEYVYGHGNGEGGYRAVQTRHVARPAHVFESEDGSRIVVATGKGGHFEDSVDLGPGGRHLHAFTAGQAYPTEPLVLPRDSLDALKEGRLSREEHEAGVEAARELIERVAGPAPSP